MKDRILKFVRDRVDPQARLARAARAGHADVVKRLLASGVPLPGPRPVGEMDYEKYGEFLNFQDAADSLLHDAAELGHLEVVKVLVEAGMDIEGSANATPLFRAAVAAHADAVQYLAARGATVDYRVGNSDNDTTLTAACASQYPERKGIDGEAVVATLISQGADLNVTNGWPLESHHHLRPLHVAHGPAM